MAETHTFPLSPRYWQNRVSRVELGDLAASDPEYVREQGISILPVPSFEATITARTKFRVLIELDEAEAAEVIADIDAILPLIAETEPGLETSALEARLAILQVWPHLDPTTESNNVRRDPPPSA